ncbi:polysaccharide deacetylase family protein [Streptomyces sp. BE230]|uniref:polysaccharide deacetylase family protein n=1 Tax=Streptomyces sp. BE230 TaxID=3002526 RepID=UPI002ED52567|nr:polysaccharide deacetylase family protein [Streptomyces sp. BE230]
MYHLVEDLPTSMAVPPDRFAEQMEFLEGGPYSVITEQDLHDLVRRRAPLPAKAVLITFDDGYANTVSTALPLLERHGLPALMAVCGGYLTSDLPRRVPHPVDAFADIEQIGRWADSGRSLAAHSYTHPRLTAASDLALAWQTAGDREVLTELLGHEPRTFVYPYGAHDARVRSAVARLYPLALATDEHQAPDSDRPYALSRIQVDPGWTLEAFRAALEAGTDPCAAQLAARRVVLGTREGNTDDGAS